jgi:hypothetical protein
MKRMIITLTVVALAIGCSGGSPTEPISQSSNVNPTSCGANCDNILHVPALGDSDAAMIATRDKVRNAVQNGSLHADRTPDWNALPRIEWVPCWFTVQNASWVNASGQTQVGSNCAAGMTDYQNQKIVISTNEPARTLPLVQWETANYFLIAIGRSDLADRWQGT